MMRSPLGAALLLHARLPALRDPETQDERFLASALRDRWEERVDGIPHPRRSRRGKADCSCRSGGRSTVATVSPVLGQVEIAAASPPEFS